MMGLLNRIPSVTFQQMELKTSIDQMVSRKRGTSNHEEYAEADKPYTHMARD